jgi:putative transposase
MKKRTFVLEKLDLERIELLLSKGNLSNRFVKRCDCLKLLSLGKTQKEVSTIVGFNEATIGGWRKKYTSDGLSFLNDQPRPGRPIVIDGEQRAKITALACEATPEGYSHWSLRVLADKIVELGICTQISHEQVSKILKKMN